MNLGTRFPVLAILAMMGWTMAMPAGDAPASCSFSVPASEVLSGAKIFLAPASALHAFAPGGYEAADEYLAAGAEIWQGPVAKELRELLAKRKIPTDVVVVPPEEFKDKMEAILVKRNLEGFYDTGTGKFDDALFESVMSELAKQYGGMLVAPRVVMKWTKVKQLWTGEKAPKAKWDGVSRKVEKGGGHFSGHAWMRGSRVPVLSLRLEGYRGDMRAFRSDGGFDIVWYAKVRFFRVKAKETPVDMVALFGPKNEEDIEEAVQEALRPLAQAK